MEIIKGTTFPLHHDGEHIADLYFNGMSITITPTPEYGIHVSRRLSPSLYKVQTNPDPTNIVATFYND